MLRKWWLFGLLICFACEAPDEGQLFKKVSSGHSNIEFKNLLEETEVFNVLKYGYFYNGGGVAIGDINNDGLADIYFTGNMVRSHLYLNQGGLEFKEIAIEAGVEAAGLWNTGVTMADVNGDGYLDIYVCRSAAVNPANRRNLLFINNGDLTFTEHAETFGIADTGYSTQAAFFDYDRDGDLDLYLLNHSVQEYAGFSSITASLKEKYNPDHGDKLYRNDQVLFTDVSRGAGIKSNVLGFGLGVAIADLNADGWPDVYVSNDYNEQDYLYINNQDGTFSDQLETYMDHVSLFSMGSDIGDINNDGYPDLITLDMLPEGNARQKLVFGPDNYEKYQRLVNSGFYNQSMRNMLQLNQGGQGFSEIGQLSGISNTDWSWASLFADFDNDGYQDLFITNGYQRDYTNMDFMNFMVSETLKQRQGGPQMATMEAITRMPSINEPNYVYRNAGDLTFQKVNQSWGITEPSLSNGAAYGDLDNDGDLDLVVNNIQEQAFLYENRGQQLNPNHFLAVRLVGDSLNTTGVGASVYIYGAERLWYQQQMPTRGFQSSVDHQLVFGLGSVNNLDSVKVVWSDGLEQVVRSVTVDQTLEVHKKGTKVDNSVLRNSPTWFTEDSITYLSHQENLYVDFKQQQLLPHKLSTQGPRLAKADINGDQMDDLFMPGAQGSSGRILIQTPQGDFTSIFETDSTLEEVDALFFDADGDEDLDLYVVSGGVEFDANSSLLVDRYYENLGNLQFVYRPQNLPDHAFSGSVVVSNDLDGDGDLDLLVGGRVVPGQYPKSPGSQILINDGKGLFTMGTDDWCPALQQLGMVTDATWINIDQDEEKELLIVGEWMAVKVFDQQQGKLIDISEQAATNHLLGWWNRISPLDLDNDGDQDFILGNFGANAQIKADTAEPVTLHVFDFDDNGTDDPILSYYVQGVSYPAFSKDDLEQQLPLIKKKYISYKDYADKTLKDIFGDQLEQASVLKADHLLSGYLENLGDGTFEFHAFPLSAQVAPVFGINTVDLEGDGIPEILLAGNFMGSRVKFGNYDANHGVLLKWESNEIVEVPNISSGLRLRGEFRDIVRVQTSVGPRWLFVRNNDKAQIYGLTP